MHDDKGIHGCGDEEKKRQNDVVHRPVFGNADEREQKIRTMSVEVLRAVSRRHLSEKDLDALKKASAEEYGDAADDKKDERGDPNVPPAQIFSPVFVFHEKQDQTDGIEEDHLHLKRKPQPHEGAAQKGLAAKRKINSRDCAHDVQRVALPPLAGIGHIHGQQQEDSQPQPMEGLPFHGGDDLYGKHRGDDFPVERQRLDEIEIADGQAGKENEKIIIKGRIIAHLLCKTFPQRHLAVLFHPFREKFRIVYALKIGKTDPDDVRQGEHEQDGRGFSQRFFRR